MIYFDNAATTFPKPERVLKSVQSGILHFGGNPGRSGHKMSMIAAEKIFSIRQNYADFFGADVENVIFTSNCTHALNLAIKGVMTSGHAITSILEHNSVLRPLNELKRKNIISYDIANVFELDEDVTLREFESRIRPNTKAIICTHASNVTGTILPIKKLGELCKKRGLIFIVDAAQTAGVLPINMRELNINLLCLSGHKSLMGVTGTGMMVLNGIDKMETIIEGGTGSTSVDLIQPDFCPDRFESGTANTVGIMSLGAGLDFIKRQGSDKLYRHELMLCERFIGKLRAKENIVIYTENISYQKKVPVVCFNIKGATSTEIVDFLSNRGFALRGGLHCAPLTHDFLGTKEIGAVRFSPGVFNKTWEVDKLVQTIKGFE